MDISADICYISLYTQISRIHSERCMCSVSHKTWHWNESYCERALSPKAITLLISSVSTLYGKSYFESEWVSEAIYFDSFIFTFFKG